MPSTMMHLAAGWILWPEGSDAFFLGCILPDCVDADRARKDHLHFRDIPSKERLPRIVAFAKTLDLSRDFDLGVLFHFYLDTLWDNGPQAQHRESYTGTSWFSDYRKELSRAGSRVAQRCPFTRELWTRLRDPEEGLYQNSLDLPKQEILSFLENNYLWHTQVCLPPSDIFTDTLVEGFLKAASEKFTAFCRQEFSRETKDRPFA